jgi:predicted amidophosphoribosyltransferase
MSGKTSTESKAKYNKKAYSSHLYKYRKHSELGEAIEKFKSQKGTSFNYLITKLLCDHFDAPWPHPENDNS